MIDPPGRPQAHDHGDLAAVLFDMDGTLVDSETVWDVGLRELAARYGAELSDRARQAIVGRPTLESVRILHEDIATPERDAVAAAAWLDARVQELFARGLEWLPGAHELLAAVRASGLPTGLVTNTKRALVESALATIGRGNFDVIVCGDEVPRTKPDPAPYLAAAAALGVPPGRCAVLEDSPSGVASAVAAGCAVIGVPNHAPLTGTGFLLRASLVEVDLDLLRLIVRGRNAAAPSAPPPSSSPSPSSSSSSPSAGSVQHLYPSPARERGKC